MKIYIPDNCVSGCSETLEISQSLWKEAHIYPVSVILGARRISFQVSESDGKLMATLCSGCSSAIVEVEILPKDPYMPSPTRIPELALTLYV